MILVSEFMTSAFKPFFQAYRLLGIYFEKTSIHHEIDKIPLSEKLQPSIPANGLFAMCCSHDIISSPVKTWLMFVSIEIKVFDEIQIAPY